MSRKYHFLVFSKYEILQHSLLCKFALLHLDFLFGSGLQLLEQSRLVIPCELLSCAFNNFVYKFIDPVNLAFVGILYCGKRKGTMHVDLTVSFMNMEDKA